MLTIPYNTTFSVILDLWGVYIYMKRLSLYDVSHSECSSVRDRV